MSSLSPKNSTQFDRNMRSLLYIAVAMTCCASAAPRPVPVNLLDKAANWQADVKTCQHTVSAKFVPAAVIQAHATTAVCEVQDDSVSCRDVASSGGLAAGYSPQDKLLDNDDQARQEMLVSCLSDMGWRQPQASERRGPL
jgi:hypothetical protein